MASRVVRARLDRSSARALGLLMSEGRNESEAVRAALEEAARRRTTRSALVEEVRALAESEDDSTERHAILADLETASPAWPD